MAIKINWHIVLFGFVSLLMPTSAQALVINEIHFNPFHVGDDDGEFIELYNEKRILLTSWTIQWEEFP